jgi:hypothetical protein
MCCCRRAVVVQRIHEEGLTSRRRWANDGGSKGGFVFRRAVGLRRS